MGKASAILWSGTPRTTNQPVRSLSATVRSVMHPAPLAATSGTAAELLDRLVQRQAVLQRRAGHQIAHREGEASAAFHLRREQTTHDVAEAFAWPRLHEAGVYLGLDPTARLTAATSLVG